MHHQIIRILSIRVALPGLIGWACILHVRLQRFLLGTTLFHTEGEIRLIRTAE